MTQREVAEVLSVEPGTISKYESNLIEPNIGAIKTLAEIFEVSIDELLNDEESDFNIDEINVLQVLREQKK